MRPECLALGANRLESAEDRVSRFVWNAGAFVLDANHEGAVFAHARDRNQSVVGRTRDRIVAKILVAPFVPRAFAPHESPPAAGRFRGDSSTAREIVSASGR